MKILTIVFAPAILTLTCLLSGCATGSGGDGPLPPSGAVVVLVSPQLRSVVAGSTTEFTAEINGTSNSPTWSLTNSATAVVGTLAPVSGSPNAILYTAPPTPPVYTILPIPYEGTATLNATATDPQTGSVGTTSLTFYVTAPTITVGIVPTTASLQPGQTEQFLGYAVGSTDTAVTWLVNGAPNSSGGTYTASGAPGSQVTVTAVSVADPTKSASAIVTIQ